MLWRKLPAAISWLPPGWTVGSQSSLPLWHCRMTGARDFVVDLTRIGKGYQEIKETIDAAYCNQSLQKTVIYAIIKKFSLAHLPPTCAISVWEKKKSGLRTSLPLLPLPSKKIAVFRWKRSLPSRGYLKKPSSVFLIRIWALKRSCKIGAIAAERWPFTGEGLGLLGFRCSHQIPVQVHSGLHCHHRQKNGIISNSGDEKQSKQWIL